MVGPNFPTNKNPHSSSPFFALVGIQWNERKKIKNKEQWKEAMKLHQIDDNAFSSQMETIIVVLNFFAMSGKQVRDFQMTIVKLLNWSRWNLWLIEAKKVGFLYLDQFIKCIIINGILV